MAGKFLIDITDARFRIVANDAVMGFIRRANPFAHSDVGIVLLELGKERPGAYAYCPSFKSCAFVVLHTDECRIFAIAYGQSGLAFRVAAGELGEALADGGETAPAIGPDWVSFRPWNRAGETGTRDRLRRWRDRAYVEAMAANR